VILRLQTRGTAYAFSSLKRRSQTKADIPAPHLVARPIVLGIILGLGFAFMIEGAKMMSENWWIGGAALSVWHVGIAFVVGMVAYWLNKRGHLRV
jgi:hypothetical protein